MQLMAENFLGVTVTITIIIVPLYFTDAHRKAVLVANNIAGFTVFEIQPESIAACLAFGLERTSGANRKVLVFDLGEGTFDVLVMNVIVR
jgi:molecular chaperone DnaK (HSP70)